MLTLEPSDDKSPHFCSYLCCGDALLPSNIVEDMQIPTHGGSGKSVYIICGVLLPTNGGKKKGKVLFHLLKVTIG